MKTLKRILTILLTVQLVVAVVGFSVYFHNCSCKNTITTSIFVENSCCAHHEQPTNSCCEKEAPSCHNKSHKDCSCKTELKVLTIQNSFAPSYTLVKFQPVGIDFNIDLKSIDTESTTDIAALNYEAIEPPPKWGKALVISNCSLKIPFHIS